MRKANIKRKTEETKIRTGLNIDGNGKSDVSTGIGFLDHMLSVFANQGMFGLVVRAKGDLKVDEHHTVEDAGIALGEAFKKALGKKRGIRRYGTGEAPMDEALARVSVDLSERSYLVFNADFSRTRVGDMSTELVEDFFQAFARSSGTTIHVNLLYGRNNHHKIEAVFKGFGLAMRSACEDDKRRKGVPSTKGILG